MSINGADIDGQPEDIYFFRPTLPRIDTSTLFSINEENGNLRVRSRNTNCLFRHLTRDIFDEIYNDFNRHLNLDFTPLHMDGKMIFLPIAEQDELFESIIIRWMYFYTINNLKVEVKRDDFKHPYMVDDVLLIVDRKFGKDTTKSLALGARILRQELHDYINTVKGRRLYHDR